MKITPSARDFVGFVDNITISEVNCSHNGIGMVETMPKDCNSRVADCGIDDLTAADCERTTETFVVTQRIFENPFADEWTATEPDPLTHTTIIDHVIRIWDFPSDSVMVRFIDQQQWSTLEHVVSVGFEEVGEFLTVRDDGITFEDTPTQNLCRFKAFLLYYKLLG
jgi:hypothetical protein